MALLIDYLFTALVLLYVILDFFVIIVSIFAELIGLAFGRGDADGLFSLLGDYW